MKKALSIVICFCILLQAFSAVVIFAGYQWNKDYISRELCVNKDKPKSCCEGKCFLKKELEQEQKEQTPPTKEKQETVQFFESRKVVEFTISDFGREPVRFYVARIQQGFSPDIFHPPGC